jgi:2-polyprenyl-3-methyl-5-hydroxy-6-metoxy-1,4-benzoquinol methylase
MINGNGYGKYCTWEHSKTIEKLYAQRCNNEAEEMTCARQAAEILHPLVKKGDEVLDAGCGSGFFFHSLKKWNIPAEYYGIDASQKLIDIGRSILPAWGLPAERLQVMRIEDLDGKVDHVICMNVLSHIDNYPRPLERLLQCAKKTLILRESLAEKSSYQYVIDKYLDEDVTLKVHINTYSMSEVKKFIESYGFSVTESVDLRTEGKPEYIIDYPHYWKFLVARRIN